MTLTRRTATLVLFLLLGALSACSLLVSLDGLAGPSSDSEAGDAPTDTTADAPSDSPAADSSPDATDGGPAVPTDASWQLVTSDGFAFDTSPDAATVSTTQPVKAGDLLLVGCDTDGQGGNVTLDVPSSIATFVQVGPFRYPASGNTGYEAVVFVAIVAQAPTGGELTITARPTKAVSFMDCTINVYRGGTAAAAVVDTKVASGTGPGRVKCGPVATVRGGIAYYIAVRYQCAGLPLQTFTQLNSLEGNPNGNLVPTDGAVAESELNDCAGSTGDWVCLTVSVSP